MFYIFCVDDNNHESLLLVFVLLLFDSLKGLDLHGQLRLVGLVMFRLVVQCKK